VLLDIVSYFATRDTADGNTRVLLSLCHTSRLLLTIAQPALYTCIHLPEDAKDSSSRLRRLLQTLEERPLLAKATQELSLFASQVRYSEGFYLLPHTRFGQQVDLAYYAEAIAVLSKAVKLQHLCVTVRFEHPRVLLQRLHQSQTETGILPRLKTFRLYLSISQQVEPATMIYGGVLWMYRQSMVHMFIVCRSK
jgi:hypothetical protein